jgi:hypothetical protein
MTLNDFEKTLQSDKFDPNTAGPSGGPLTSSQVQGINELIDAYGIRAEKISETTEKKWYLPKGMEKEKLEKSGGVRLPETKSVVNEDLLKEMDKVGGI